MGEIDYNALLYDKMKAEQDKYRDWLLSQPPEEILNHTYEYTMREDIVMCMEELELSPKQAKALLRSPCPLDDVYKEFRDREVEHMDTIRDSIETRANDVLKRDKNREGEEMAHKLKTIRADMLMLQYQLERELIRYVKRYLAQPRTTLITEDEQFVFMCELYDYVENTEFSPEMVSSLMKTKNVLELSWDMWIDDGFLEDGEDSIKKVAELLQKGKI